MPWRSGVLNLDGLEATRLIRAHELSGQQRTPIIAMTAHPMKGDHDRCIAAGMDDYLSKPIRVEELLEKLRSLSPRRN
ncbi:MAG: response regulator [Bryobacterales bacterium]|nr:response regulator [Bryobacterales bacterium]